MSISEIGLAENELSLVLGDYTNNIHLDRLKCAQIFRQFKPFLQFSFVQGIQFISFSHKSFKKVYLFN